MVVVCQDFHISDQCRNYYNFTRSIYVRLFCEEKLFSKFLVPMYLKKSMSIDPIPIHTIAVDLDGTLLNSKSRISPLTHSVLQKAIDQGKI